MNWKDSLEEDSGARGDKYEISMRVTLLAPDMEEAEAIINDIIKEVKLRYADNDEEDPIYEYDIDDVNPATF